MPACLARVRFGGCYFDEKLHSNTVTSESKDKAKKQLTDMELIRCYLERRAPDCFSELYDRYAPKVFGKCLALLKDRGEAEDATQEIFVKIFSKMGSFDQRSKFSTWLYSITYNLCIDRLRKKKKERELFSEELENKPEVVVEVDDKELMEMELDRLKVVLERIPEGDKMLLLMKYLDGMQIKEIAKILDKTESAIKMRIKRAKFKARKIYEDLYASVE